MRVIYQLECFSSNERIRQVSGLIGNLHMYLQRSDLRLFVGTFGPIRSIKQLKDVYLVSCEDNMFSLAIPRWEYVRLELKAHSRKI